MRNVALLLCFMVTATIATAQTGYVNSQALLQAMPETQASNKELMELRIDLASQISDAESNAQKRVKSIEYKVSDPELSELERQDLQTQYTELQQELAKIKQGSERTYAQKEQELMNPVSKKISDAIAKIAKSKGLSIVVDISSVAYALPGLNITLEVAKELGLKTDTPTDTAQKN